MQHHAVEDLQKAPQLTRIVVDYLSQLDSADEYLTMYYGCGLAKKAAQKD